jgi:methionine salvage enolase-phosphatase E1
MSTGVMVSVGKFLSDNSGDLKAGIATAIATSWAARQHPVPAAPALNYDRKGQ